MSARARANQELLSRIVRIHQQSHETYGSPRVWAALRRQGVICGENRVARMMRWAGLQGRVVKVTRRALTHALQRSKPAAGCIFHSDRGVEYGSDKSLRVSPADWLCR